MRYTFSRLTIDCGAASMQDKRVTIRHGSTVSRGLRLVRAAALIVIFSVAMRAQNAPEGGRHPNATGQSAGGGMANAGPQQAQFDSQHRPITAGGFVKTGPIVFENVAGPAGLTAWHHQAGTPEKRLILEAKGPGVCLLDYDNDGWLDIYLVNGSTYDALAGKSTPPHAALFHNNHDGTFTDVTAKAGVANDRWGYGCAVGDFDNDGWPDLLLRTSARTACTAITMTELLPTRRRRRA